jgi:predicted permease
MRIARWLYTLPLRIRSLFRRDAVERELDDEIRDHIEHQTAANMSAGMSATDARRAALREFGGVELRKEEVRDTRRVAHIENVFQDVRYAGRVLRKSPGFTAIAVLTLALGIGANTAIFAVVQSVLLRPRVYPHPERLVRLFETDPRGNMLGLSKLDLVDWRAQSTTIAHFAAYSAGGIRIEHDAPHQWTRSADASTDFFEVFGVAPILGTGLTTVDGGVVISETLWRTRFASAPDIIGKTILVRDSARVINGVMPASFDFPNGAKIWMPQDMVPRIKTARTIRFWSTVAELKPGVAIGTAQAELSTIATRLAETYPGMNAGVGAKVMDLEESITGKIKPTLILLSVMAGLVLLVACTNLANLMLARAVSRRRELAVRAALGATRQRLARQLLTESLLLGVAGAAVGLPIAFWSSKLLRATPMILGLVIPTQTSAGWVFAFAIVMALGTAIVFGTAPAMRAARVDVVTHLKAAGARGVTAVGMSGALVIGEVALATLLLIGAALTGRSLAKLEGASLGYDASQLVYLDPGLRSLQATDRGRLSDVNDLLARVRTLPGVSSAAILTIAPLSGIFQDASPVIEGEAGGDRAAWHQAAVSWVSEGYFHTLGIPFKAGRDFVSTDEHAAPVVLINETMAKTYWPARNPIGARVALPEVDTTAWALHARGQELWYTVIGIVGDTRDAQLGVPPQPSAYLPVYSGPDGLLGIVARSTAPLSATSRALTDVAASMNKGSKPATTTMSDMVARSVATPSLRTFIVLAFAGLAIVLAAMGVYGVAAHITARRTSEIGIRMALGARPGQALLAVMTRILSCAIAGLAVGIVAAMASVQLVQSFLYGIGIHDFVSFAGAALIVATVAILATWIPARRATRIDPTEALRAE